MEYHEIKQLESDEIAWMANIQDDEYVHKLLTTRFDHRSKNHVIISQQIYMIVLTGMIGDERYDLSTIDWKHTHFRLPFDITITYVQSQNHEENEYLSVEHHLFNDFVQSTSKKMESEFTKVYVRGTTLNNFFRHFHQSINPGRAHGYPFERFLADTERTVMVGKGGLDGHTFKVNSFI